VSLSDELAGATIWYTLDGTDPVPGSSPRYIAPLSIADAQPVTLKAVATSAGYKPSDVLTATLTNLDPDGPVIDRVVYYLGNPTPGSGGERPDTLVIRFSEPVPCAGLDRSAPALFTYVDADGEYTEADILGAAQSLAPCTGQAGTVTLLVPPEGKIVPLEDALQLKPGQLSDRYGNVNELEEPVVIEWGRQYPAVTTALTLFTPGDPIPPGVLERVSAEGPEPPATHGTFIRVFAVQGLDMAASKMTVYDAVGNLIRGSLPAYRERDGGKRFWFFWDGANQRGRTVGTGTYLAVAKLILRDGTSSVERIRLGVRR
jgi:hypothetical protein